MTTCYFSSHASAENRSLLHNVVGTYFDNVVDIYSKESLPEVTPNSILISDRTTFFFSEEYLNQFDLAFNVHPSLLPSHKGSFPILWACLAGEPHGVSIHEMNPEVDAGQIVWQKEVPYDENESFSQVFYRSRQYIIHALHQTCSQIIHGTVFDHAIKQEPDPFHHKKKDGELLLSCMPLRWHTPILEARKLTKDIISSFA